MPFKRKESPHWQVSPTVPGYGRVGPWSTGTTNKDRAEAMERMLKELPLEGQGEVLKLIPDQFTVADLYVARLEDRIDELVETRENPTLPQAIDDMRFLVNQRIRYGLDALEDLLEETNLPTGKLEDLTDPKLVRELLQRRENQGVKRNTVRRGMYQAIKALVRHYRSKTAVRKLTDELDYRKEDDERRVDLTQEEIKRLLDACTDDYFRQFVKLALLTGIDRGPLLQIRPSDLDGNVLVVRDTKTTSRPRKLQLGPEATATLQEAVAYAEDRYWDHVFPYSVDRFNTQWREAREGAGLGHVRFKDLRGVFATRALESGMSPKDLMQVMGHSSLDSTMRYIRRLPVKREADMAAAEATMGFGRDQERY